MRREDRKGGWGWGRRWEQEGEANNDPKFGDIRGSWDGKEVREGSTGSGVGGGGREGRGKGRGEESRGEGWGLEEGEVVANGCGYRMG